ncbi:MAG: hypothetical protein HYX81_02980 [Chloroflexi bacterium]|nr:hypothetical protein [Chloroflexota bacterium]
MPKHNIFQFLLVLFLVALLTACVRTPPPRPAPLPAAKPIPAPFPQRFPPTTPIPPEEIEKGLRNHFGFFPAIWDFKTARESGAAFDRPFFEFFQWGMIEKNPGQYDFSETDRYVYAAQISGLNILANIQPFASWDQPGKGKPRDMLKYRNFVSRLVERYDGDGIDDMPGLNIPIKHWEVSNEPEFQQAPLVFFQGTPQDYFEVLKATYEEVKRADPQAFVLQGGMAGMIEVSTAFWQSVFDLGGAKYFDIANIHSIGHGEHLNIPTFEQFLAKNNIEKPIWVTEVQFQQARQTQGYTAADFARTLARSYIFALANGAEKLFYVNIKMPPVKSGVPFSEKSALITDQGERSPIFYAHLTVATMLGAFERDDTVEIIKEEIGDWRIDEGQYRFSINGKTIYALWGTGSPPLEITGKIKVTEISGEQRIMDASALSLAESPIFVEPELGTK